MGLGLALVLPSCSACAVIAEVAASIRHQMDRWSRIMSKSLIVAENGSSRVRQSCTLPDSLGSMPTPRHFRAVFALIRAFSDANHNGRPAPNSRNNRPTWPSVTIESPLPKGTSVRLRTTQKRGILVVVRREKWMSLYTFP